MLTFSIVIPVYNVEKYLEQCIESIINQTYSEWEILLIDDGSTDGSNTICKEYVKKDKRIKLFEKSNSGQADSRNFGVEKATGDYLIFVDSDDYIDENTLQSCYDECRKWNMPDVIISEGMYEVWGNKLGGYHNWDAADYCGLSGRDTLVKTMKVAPNWSPCGKCYNLQFWRDHNFKFPTRRLAEDFALIDKVVLEAKCVCMLPSFYYYRRFRENSTMSSVNKKLKYDELLNLLDWEQYLQEKKLDDELVDAFQKIFASLFCHDILGNVFLFKGSEKENILQKAGEMIPYMDYAEGREEKMVRIMVKTVGLRVTCWLLGIIKQYRIKKERLKYLRNVNEQ